MCIGEIKRDIYARVIFFPFWGGIISLYVNQMTKMSVVKKKYNSRHFCCCYLPAPTVDWTTVYADIFEKLYPDKCPHEIATPSHLLLC